MKRLIAAAIPAIVLAACGSGGGEPAAVSTPVQVQTQSVPQADAASPTPQASMNQVQPVSTPRAMVAAAAQPTAAASSSVTPKSASATQAVQPAATPVPRTISTSLLATALSQSGGFEATADGGQSVTVSITGAPGQTTQTYADASWNIGRMMSWQESNGVLTISGKFSTIGASGNAVPFNQGDDAVIASPVPRQSNGVLIAQWRLMGLSGGVSAAAFVVDVDGSAFDVCLQTSSQGGSSASASRTCSRHDQTGKLIGASYTEQSCGPPSGCRSTTYRSH